MRGLKKKNCHIKGVGSLTREFTKFRTRMVNSHEIWLSPEILVNLSWGFAGSVLWVLQ